MTEPLLLTTARVTTFDGDRLLMRSGWWRRRTVILPLDKIQSIDLTESFISRLFGIERPEIVATHIHRWTRAVPIYGPEVSSAWEVARRTFCARPGNLLFGNYSGQVSLRGMIESAAKLATELHNPSR